jgi:hypothetical protein
VRAHTTTRLALAGAALVAATALVSCSNSTDGTATCPGCGSNAEPNFPTPRPTIAAPPLSPSPAPGPAPTATAAPAPGAETLPANAQGYVYVETKSGKTRCQLNSETVGCESQFESAPIVDGEPANSVSVSSGGNVNWISGNLGNIPVVTLDYQTYVAQGWTIAADPSGTRFTNDSTGHGMFVAVEGVESF